MVTAVVNQSGSQPVRLTWTIVQPGDHLLFPSPIIRGASTSAIPVQLSIPPLSGTTRYDLTIMCEGSGVSNQTNVATGTYSGSVNCIASAQHATACVTAIGTSGRSYAVGNVAPIAASGTTTISVGAWSGGYDFSATVTGAGGFDTNSMLVAPAPVAGAFGVVYHFASGPGGDPMTIGPASIPQQWGGTTFVELQSSVSPSHTVELSRAFASSSSLSLSLTSDFLPIFDASLDAGLPRPKVTITSNAATADYDLVIIKVADWYLIAPGRVGALEYPVLPSDLLPTGSTTSLVGACVRESSEVSGYADAKLDPYRAAAVTESEASSYGDPLVCAFD
jgi:hypothetical protein